MRRLALVAATENGRRSAAHLARVLPGAEVYGGPAKEALARAWREADGIVAFLAVGATARLVAPLLGDKRTDPGVVCVDDARRFAVALVGGHEGGANELARRVAETLGAEAVITTASDVTDHPALDAFGRDLGFKLERGSDVASVASALVSGETVRLISEWRYPLGPLPENVVPGAPQPGVPSVVVSDRTGPFPTPSVVYRPPTLVVGVGCSRWASEGEILDLVSRSLQDAGLAPGSVASLASVDAKRDEAGLLGAAERLGVPVRFFPARELADRPVPNPSEAALRAVGTPSVAEAAVLASGAELVAEKRKSPMATCAVGRLPVRGRLYLVGLGPGDEALIPPLAREALARSEIVVGLAQYLERVRHLLRPGTRTVEPPLGREVERAGVAVEEARLGGSAALVSSGDIGVYAMASPALEIAGTDVDVVVVPGVTASQAAASLLGSPLGHDHASVSLSDLLTPWEVILKRLTAAAEGDFVVSLYNPRSKGRDWQLEKAKGVLLEHRPPDTPVGIVRDAYRPAQSVRLTTLADLDPESVDMLTVVLVGSSRTVVRAGRMVTPRGYEL
ncbi:precorrin-3B C17-methyltransferase [Rubrobacter radiotolerans]|uniref:Precorrin-3B C(17)-methyltransferase n=1 Tax=Rubrobacter radiotolerans TaxID=42256 RepID=A0A023X237_RUBRA|nr:precorrin-3B C(17)-methyltransferase [Rubrobacter radiotolerans]AHY46104.1 precorrin-3B C17-methyltransferase [Rubrobacter radiotolerans]MDX5893514.1 precorrin-3B C(17)-methyltransferase [Rubrobacter radiotolerans]SMC03892.1 cobalt-precorrin 5A hydrolase / precorrin-3B C17-methyltransferase [Rubrobacter radiotolerans DSM 5868]